MNAVQIPFKYRSNYKLGMEMVLVWYAIGTVYNALSGR